MSKALAELGKTLSFYTRCETNDDCQEYFELQKITTGCCAKLELVSPMYQDDEEEENAEKKLSWVFEYV